MEKLDTGLVHSSVDQSSRGQWLRSSYSADVSVVIVNYNTRVMLERTLDTLLSSGQQSVMEIIVVDNASKDGSVEMVCQKFPQVICLANQQNRGHTGGSNQGMACAAGRYLFLLNSDTIILPKAVDILVRYLDTHPHVGAVAGKVLNVDGTIQGTIKSFPTPLAALFGRYSVLTRLFPRNPFSRRYLVYLDQDFTQPFTTDSASACALMARREVVQRAGPLDERYFLYWNDVDWCRGIWEAGYEVHCVPQSVIVHDEHKGGTRAGWKRILTSTLDFHRGAYRYYRKWHVTQAWSPRHLAVIAALTLRAMLVLATEQVRWIAQRKKKLSQ
jgi:GT2 family glycosyltransferase